MSVADVRTPVRSGRDVPLAVFGVMSVADVSKNRSTQLTLGFSIARHCDITSHLRGNKNVHITCWHLVY